MFESDTTIRQPLNSPSLHLEPETSDRRVVSVLRHTHLIRICITAGKDIRSDLGRLEQPEDTSYGICLTKDD